MRHLLTIFSRRIVSNKEQRLQALSLEEVEDLVDTADNEV